MEQTSSFITAETFDPTAFDIYLLMFSGGKDSIVSLLTLLEMGIPRSKIELWHHRVDGEAELFMDWPVTDDYVRKFAEAFELPVYYSWRIGGFEREMLRENQRTAPMVFETPYGVIQTGGTQGKLSTRRKFPQQSPNLSVRWCSASIKIDVASSAISNQPRFHGKRVLVVTGERAEESAARAKYAIAEPHKTRALTLRRDVWQYRPVHSLTEKEVWAMIEKYRINPHPAYRLGWGRLSCMTCIFGSPHQWCSVQQIAPKRVIKIANYEKAFGVTLRRDGPIEDAIARGTPYKMDPEIVKLAMSTTFDEPIFIDNWQLPAGAFGESTGPS